MPRRVLPIPRPINNSLVPINRKGVDTTSLKAAVTVAGIPAMVVMVSSKVATVHRARNKVMVNRKAVMAPHARNNKVATVRRARKAPVLRVVGMVRRARKARVLRVRVTVRHVRKEIMVLRVPKGVALVRRARKADPVVSARPVAVVPVCVPVARPERLKSC